MDTPMLRTARAFLLVIALLYAIPVELGATITDTGHHVVTVSQSRADPGVPRDHRGRVARSAAAKRAFRHHHPCPATGQSRGICPGYVIDHVQPLKRGGRDAPENMQWQTVQDAKIKDRTE